MNRGEQPRWHPKAQRAFQKAAAELDQWVKAQQARIRTLPELHQEQACIQLQKETGRRRKAMEIEHGCPPPTERAGTQAHEQRLFDAADEVPAAPGINLTP